MNSPVRGDVTRVWILMQSGGRGSIVISSFGRNQNDRTFSPQMARTSATTTAPTVPIAVSQAGQSIDDDDPTDATAGETEGAGPTRIAAPATIEFQSIVGI